MHVTRMLILHKFSELFQMSLLILRVHYFRYHYESTQLITLCQQTMVQEQEGHPVWGIYAQRLLDPQSGLWRNPSGGGHDDKAHPPIHPTKFSAGETRWSQDHHVSTGSDTILSWWQLI